MGRNSSEEKPLILICNDDGIDARGIRALAAALDGLGELCVVAPEREQSAAGHSITVRDPVRAFKHQFEVPSGPINAWAVTGTPADCVKLARNRLVEREPALVVSGINQGPNTAVNVLYSGTVSAASEACILGYPAFAISLCSWDPESDFEAAGIHARRIAAAILKKGLPDGILLNVNVPEGAPDEIEGVEITRQAVARWEEEFTPRVDPFNRPYYWMAGRFVNLDDDGKNDLAAIKRRYVSITPLRLDLTAYDQLDDLAEWNWD
jgi:5'-nucleotidase